ncbi:MAG: tRNA (adenosine(37)-N6)-threonylcarbamoyltransferase complex transferase subunit TsaD [Bacteroidota bacterium]|nr:tRNA (adenosine(37)-N6)-threonylcarbamoyltransferase complex transferase subunit TsaD [Bacteroidota bacterium]MDP4234537.1 tRNA (adenosine(37)-N6)-threonylcarbamoyltransferase complex transferase subunit TsaD [Bacteroidota bacterium]MDP4242602.1 tRNA (adenosine(37)-N6)-threonylcarbamoyltransferase complex transferase subunit TsaD [Bacteroidota bacterium]MDP4289178.1 tRNA (adenosine(37)-N6)-threonylcarbamoyltransferase complex transferase subunit TsaD [Bacteroidota bacterium]
MISLPMNGTVLGIESSCDETSAAVLRNGELASVVVSSQFFHERFGGVVPELASRAHVRSALPIIREALRQANISASELDAVAVTYAPGLMGSLLVGLSVAKGLAIGLGVPLIGVHHIEAHVFSVLLEQNHPDIPFVALIVSGGHTMLVLVKDIGEYELIGETLDDAAGEAFDKVGKLLGLAYPAGPEIDKLARDGNPNFIRFPRAMMEEGNHDFSFSGIKTSVSNWLKKHSEESYTIPDIAASFQRAVVDVLATKTVDSADRLEVRDIICAGGVSANSELRERFQKECQRHGMRFFAPRPLFSTDNAAMIAMLGALKLARGHSSDFTLVAMPRQPLARRTSINI